MRNIIIISLVLTLNGCKSAELPLKDYRTETLNIERISENIYKHVSYLETESYGKVSCNGMIYINGNDAIVFDTPTNNTASAELIKWIGEKKIKSVVITHFHVDCLGGLEEFHSNEIESYANTKTIQLAENESTALPRNSFENKIAFNIDGQMAFAEFFGEGHTSDNIVGYIPSENALFGGCLIKAVKSGKGNLVDANVNDWAKTVEKIKKELNGLEIVIPGHGKTGGSELLDFTINLFKTE